MANQPMSRPKPKPKPKAKAARRKLGPPKAVSNTMKPHPRANPKEDSFDKYLKESRQWRKTYKAVAKVSDATTLEGTKKSASEAQSMLRKMLSGPTAESNPELYKLAALTRARTAGHAGRQKRHHQKMAAMASKATPKKVTKKKK